MSFVCMPGLKGKVFIPTASGHLPQKHPCRTCYSCQLCSDERCALCRPPATNVQEAAPPEKTSNDNS
ncbi:MAG: hypothetical protein WAK95_18980 [Desulfobacterales bacterium]